MKTPTTVFAALALCGAGAAYAQDDTRPGGQTPDDIEDVNNIDSADEIDALEDDAIDEPQQPAAVAPDVEVDVQEDEGAPGIDVDVEEPQPAPPPADVDVNVEPAQPAEVDVVVPPPAPAEPYAAQPAASSSPTMDYMREQLATGFGAEVKAGVGGGDFTEDDVQDLTSGSFNWDVRAVFGGNFPIGIEGAYTGSSRNVDNSFAGGTGDTQLMSNGVEGDLRLGLPIAATELIDIRPFAFGGIGWQYMTLWGDGAVDEDSDEGDHIMTVPAGLGLDIGVGPLNVEGRGTYRHAVGSDLFGEADADFDDPDAMHSFAVTGSLGLEF